MSAHDSNDQQGGPQAEPSGQTGESPASKPADGRINPSAPEDSNATPGSTGEK